MTKTQNESALIEFVQIAEQKRNQKPQPPVFDLFARKENPEIKDPNREILTITAENQQITLTIFAKKSTIWLLAPTLGALRSRYFEKRRTT